MNLRTNCAVAVMAVVIASVAVADNARVEVGYLELQGTQYWDLNNDKIVDLELRDSGDTEGGFGLWYRIDDDYDGRYDREVEVRENARNRSKRIRTAVAPIKKLGKLRVDKAWLERKKNEPQIPR